jgi:apolipoprotein N-acyltransferase
VWGISFLVYASGAAVALVALCPRSAHVLIYLAVLVTIIYGWGLDRMTGLPPTERVRISAIQADSLFDLAKLSEEAASQGTQAVVWPEGSLDSLDQGVSDVSEKLNLLLVSGFTEKRIEGKPFNSAALIDRGRYLGAARKTHLLGKEKKQFAGNKDLRVFSPLSFPAAGAAICYDTNFTDVVRGLAARGARVVFVPNSDPVTPSGALHFLHGALMPIRAAENSIVMVRADRTGYSQIIHPSGWITSYLPIGEKGQITQEVILGSGPTIFTRMGDWFAWLSIAVVATVLLLMWKGKFHRSTKRAHIVG